MKLYPLLLCSIIFLTASISGSDPAQAHLTYVVTMQPMTDNDTSYEIDTKNSMTGHLLSTFNSPLTHNVIEGFPQLATVHELVMKTAEPLLNQQTLQLLTPNTKHTWEVKNGKISSYASQPAKPIEPPEVQ